MRNAFDLPSRTHQYFIETVSSWPPPPKTFLSRRYVNFAQSLTSSNKCSIRYLSSVCQDDKRTLLGKTLGKIGMECGVLPSVLTPDTVKRKLLYSPVPDDQKWRVPLLWELFDARSNNLTIENLTSDQISSLIENICISWRASRWWKKFSSWPPSFLFHKLTNTVA